jgi:anthranilate phosphoribosyltransferase
VAGKAENLRDGAVLADAAIRQGRARGVFESLVRESNR